MSTQATKSPPPLTKELRTETVDAHPDRDHAHSEGCEAQHISREITIVKLLGDNMRYLYYDLGEQQQENWVVAHIRGSSANVILLDPLNFDRYRFGQPFVYTGGLYTRTPARLQIPRDGNWYLVIDCGGYQHHVDARDIEILRPGQLRDRSDHTLVLG